MKLSLKTFGQLVQDMGASLQGSATSLVDVSVGSVMRAIFEANASVVLWLQWLVLQALSMTRASTSNGQDLDSWMADFGCLRLPATPSTGVVTLSRFASGIPALVPVNSIVKTADGTLSFSVTEDMTLSTWQQTSLGYVIPVGVSSADVPVTCLSGGLAGNVLAGTITTIASSLPGIDQVINASSFLNGTDAESDQAFRGRFQNYLASRTRATLTAIRVAISNVQQGLSFLIVENSGPNGAAAPGAFLIVVDDGSGYPSTTLLSSIATAVDLVRPIGTTFTVIAPTVLTVTVSLAASIGSLSALQAATASMQQKITSYLNTLPIGSVVSATRIAQNAYAASDSIHNISNVLLNGGTADIIPQAYTVAKAGQITVVTSAG